MNISTIFNSIISVIVPFIAIFVGAKVTEKQNQKEYAKDQKIQRLKLLTLLKKEALLFREYQKENNKHRSKKFITTSMILESPVFNVEEHTKLIELTLEMERINQNIDTAIDTSTSLYTNMIASYLSNLAKGSLLLTISNSKLFRKITGKTHIENVAIGMDKVNEKIIKSSTEESETILDDLITEVDRLLLYEQGG